MEDERKINWLSLFIKIVIVFIFALILIWLVTKITNSTKKSETFKNNINNMEEAAVNYFKEIDLPLEKGKSIEISLEEMLEKKLIISIKDNLKTSCDTNKSYSKITRQKKNYNIETTLVCGKEKETIKRKLDFKYCKNCNTNETTTDQIPNNTNEETPNTTNETNNSENTNTNTAEAQPTYYEYIKEWTEYSNWMRGEKTGSDIENKYEYYSIEEKTYYTIGAVEKNKSSEYTIKLDKVPNKDYYYTIIKDIEYLSNDQANYLTNNETTITEEINIKKIPNNFASYSLTQKEMTTKLSPYYRKDNFYIDVNISNINSTKQTYTNNNKEIYFVPLKITVKFISPKITTEKPNNNYETITYYRYIIKNKDIQWSTSQSLEGYTKTGNTK